MPKAVSVALPLCVLVLLTLLAAPVRGQDYRPNTALGELLAKKEYIRSNTNPGGKSILENSCIYKDSFSLSPSEPLLDHCDVAAATAQFTAKNGLPDLVTDAPGGKKVLEYHLLHNENSYFVKIYIGCAAAKTEVFAMVECKVEKNRAKPGPPPDRRPFWQKMIQ